MEHFPIRGLKVKMALRNVKPSLLISPVVCQLSNNIQTVKSKQVKLRFFQPKCYPHVPHDFAAIFRVQRMRGSDVMANEKRIAN